MILGETAGLPGVPARGTSESGVGISMLDFDLPGHEIAAICGHEMGTFTPQYLRLYRRTESGRKLPRSVATCFRSAPFPRRGVRWSEDNGDSRPDFFMVSSPGRRVFGDFISRMEVLPPVTLPVFLAGKEFEDSRAFSFSPPQQNNYGQV